jgi:hypothetical protein
MQSFVMTAYKNMETFVAKSNTAVHFYNISINKMARYLKAT